MTTESKGNISSQKQHLRRFLAVQALFALDSSADPAGTLRLLADDWELLGFHGDELEIDDETASQLPAISAEDCGAAVQWAERVWSHLDQVDSLIAPCLRGWRLPRLDGVDRAILRLCFFASRVEGSVNDAVAASEAVILAKAMGGEQSAKFVNGVIGSIMGGEGQ